MILAKEDKYLAFELKKRKIPSVHKRLTEIKQAVEKDPKWKFQLIYLSESEEASALPVQSDQKISEMLLKVNRLANDRAFEGAFLLAWATFEAAARALHRRIFAKPQSPARLSTLLAERGVISQEDGLYLKGLLSKRNSLIHGGFDTKVTSDDISGLVTIICKVRDQTSKSELS